MIRDLSQRTTRRRSSKMELQRQHPAVQPQQVLQQHRVPTQDRGREMLRTRQMIPTWLETGRRQRSRMTQERIQSRARGSSSASVRHAGASSCRETVYTSIFESSGTTGAAIHPQQWRSRAESTSGRSANPTPVTYSQEDPQGQPRVCHQVLTRQAIGRNKINMPQCRWPISRNPLTT